MTTRQILSKVTRLVAMALVAMTTASCGGDFLRTGRAPVFLTMVSLTGSDGANLLSDVSRDGSAFNDPASAEIRVDLKDPGVFSATPAEPTALNTVTITRYRVTFRRSDGRNTPGVDVPFGFDGGVNVSIPAAGSGEVTFDIVRHASKLEPPLRNLVGLGGQLVISTVAEVTFFGHDQNGNEVTVSGLMDVTFADFPDA